MEGENSVTAQVRFRKLFIGGLNSNATENDLREYFEMYGAVAGCTIHRERETGRSRGFAFVTFEDPLTVDAVQRERPHVIMGSEVTLKRAVPKEMFQAYDGLLTVNRIFVGGLRPEVTEDDLRTYFSTFGTVRKIDVMVDRNTNTRRGFAFVEFDDYDPVDKAVLRGNHVIQGQDVSVKKAKSRLEMDLLRHRISMTPDTTSPALRIHFPDFSAHGDTLRVAARASLESFDCPVHGHQRRQFL